MRPNSFYKGQASSKQTRRKLHHRTLTIRQTNLKRKRIIRIYLKQVLLLVTSVLLLTAPSSGPVEFPAVTLKVQKVPELKPKLQTITAIVASAKIPSSQPITVGATGSHTDWMDAAGIAPSDFGYVDFIVMHEGHYNPCVINGGAVDCNYAINGGQRAYGVCQSLPGTKMASAGADWATNPVTQLKWCHSYAVGRYGSWANAYAFWRAHSWW